MFSTKSAGNPVSTPRRQRDSKLLGGCVQCLVTRFKHTKNVNYKLRHRERKTKAQHPHRIPYKREFHPSSIQSIEEREIFFFNPSLVLSASVCRTTDRAGTLQANLNIHCCASSRARAATQTLVTELTCGTNYVTPLFLPRQPCLAARGPNATRANKRQEVGKRVTAFWWDNERPCRTCLSVNSGCVRAAVVARGGAGKGREGYGVTMERFGNVDVHGSWTKTGLSITL